MDGAGNHKVEKAYDNHCPKVSIKAGDGKFRDEMNYQPDEEDVYYNCEKAQRNEDKRTEYHF